MKRAVSLRRHAPVRGAAGAGRLRGDPAQRRPRRRQGEVPGQGPERAVRRAKIGTYTSIPLSQIDVEATDKVNARSLGDAQLLDWVDAQKVGARRRPRRRPSRPSATSRRASPAKVGDAARPTPTPGITLPRHPLPRPAGGRGVPAGARELPPVPLPHQPGDAAGATCSSRSRSTDSPRRSRR